MRGLGRLFDLRPGETLLVARASALLFGLVAAHTLLETARDALFLGALPVDRLAVVYAVLAILSIGASRLNRWFLSAVGRRDGLVLTLLLAAFGAVLHYLLEPTRALVFALYVFTGLVGGILVLQFWFLAGHAFTVAQGKRLFGLLAAGGVLGAVTGASGAALLLEWLPVRELLPIAAGLFLLTALVATTEAPDTALPQPEQSAPAPIAGHPYVPRLAALIAVATAAALATDYLFKSVAAASVPAEELGVFFARFYAGLNGAALIVQVMLSRWLLRRLGVLGAGVVLPFLLALGSGAALLFGAGFAALATKAADGALRHSLHRVATELAWLPLPDQIRAAAKGLVDTSLVRGAQAGMAAALLGLGALELDGPDTLAGLILTLSLVWVGLGLSLRRPYLDLFRSALARRTVEDRPPLDLRSVEVVIEALSSRNPATSVAAINLLADSGRTRLLPALILYHEAPEVLRRALEVLPIIGRRDWPPLAERLLDHEDEAVRVATVAALARGGAADRLSRARQEPSFRVRGHIAFWSGSEADLSGLLSKTGSDGDAARIGLAEAIADAPEHPPPGGVSWADVLLELAGSPAAEVARAAVGAMSKGRDPRYLPFLIGRLAVREGRSEVREAIVALGDPAFAAVESALFSERTDPRVRVHLPSTIARFGDRKAASALLTALERCREGRIRYKALRALGLLATQSRLRIDRGPLERRAVADLKEHLRLFGLHFAVAESLERKPQWCSGRLLADLLADKRQQALARVFAILQVRFPEEDLRAIEVALRTSDRVQRGQAQEFLDALSAGVRTAEFRPLLQLAVDELPAEERVARFESLLGWTLPRGAAAIELLTREPDLAVALLAERVGSESLPSCLEKTSTEAGVRAQKEASGFA